MPSKSRAQHNFMEAVGHSRKFAQKVGVPQNVGKEFSAADQKLGKFRPKASAALPKTSSKSAGKRSRRP